MLSIVGRGSITLYLFGARVRISTNNERLAKIFRDYRFVRRCSVIMDVDAKSLKIEFNEHLRRNWLNITTDPLLIETLNSLGDTFVYQTISRTEDELRATVSTELLGVLKNTLSDLNLELGTTLWPEELEIINSRNRDH